MRFVGLDGSHCRGFSIDAPAGFSDVAATIPQVLHCRQVVVLLPERLFLAGTADLVRAVADRAEQGADRAADDARVEAAAPNTERSSSPESTPTPEVDLFVVVVVVVDLTD